MLLALDLAGIFVFAISGGLVAVRNQLDIVGVVVLATATGLGGAALPTACPAAGACTGAGDEYETGARGRSARYWLTAVHWAPLVRLLL